MAKQVINIGTAANDGTGDALRTGFDKSNANFTELYDFDTALPAAAQTLTNKTITDVATNKVNARAVAVYVKASAAFADSLIPRPFKITGNEGADAAFLVSPLTDNTTPANGIIVGALALNAYGTGYTNGKVYNVNTDAWNVGDILWLQTDGQLGTTKPSTGYQQPIAQVVRKNANTGILHVAAGYPIPDAADVRFTPAGNIAATDVQAALQELDTEKAAASHTHDASAVISGTFADARISQSSVTQHQAALSITESQISDLSHDADLIKGVSIDATVSTPSDGDILVYRSAGSDWVLEAKPAGGSNPALNDVTDVTITSPADNEVLAYDTASGDWINQTAAEAGLATATQGALADSALQPSAIGVSVQAHSAILDATTASFTTADETKLDGIEAGADVTDATNVQAAGAIMDGDFTANGLMKRTGAGTYATAVEDTDYQGVLAEGAFVDGDKTKLDGIAAGAEVNTIESVTAGEPTGSDVVLNVVSLTQAEYDAGTPVATTLYIIT